MDFETSTYECFSEGLAHPDGIVRDTCLSYLKDQPVKTLTQTRCILEGLEAHGPQRFSYLHLLKGFPLDTVALEQVLELCVKWGGSGELTAVMRMLRWAGFGAGHDIGTVVEFLEQAERIETDELLMALRERQSVWSLSLEECIECLEELAAAMGGASEYPHVEIGKAEIIVDYLAKEHASEHLEVIAAEWLHLEVDPNSENADCWKIGIAIDLCGKLRLASNLERMLSLYDFDYDWHNNLIVEAIRAFESNDALLAIRERWEGLSEIQWLFLSDLFESCSVPGLEGFYREQMDNDALDYLECSRFAIGYANYGTSEAFSIAQAVTVTSGFEDMATVGQPIERGSGEAFAAEHLGPVLEGQIGRHDQALPLVGGADHVEQQLRAKFAGRDVAQFIKDHQVQLRELLFQTQQLSFFAGFHQLRNEFGHAEETDAFSLTTGGNPQCGGDVSLARPGIPDEQDILPVVDVFTTHQFGDQQLVQRRLALEVERVQSLVRGELRRIQASISSAPFPVD